LSASMGTYIMLAGDRILMGKNSWLMIHNPLTAGYGDYKQMGKQAEFLKQLANDIAEAYSAKCGKDKDEIQAMMDAETWISADEAYEMGLVDGITEDELEMRLVASISQKILTKAPSYVKAQQQTKRESDMKDKIISALALDNDVKDADIVAKVKNLNNTIADLKAQLSTKAEDLTAKAELIDGLKASIASKDAEIEELSASVIANEQAKMLSALTDELGVMLSDEVEARASTRIKRILAEKDEAVKAELIEDAKLFVKAYGVKNTEETKSDKRLDFSANKTSFDAELELVEMTNKIIQEKGYGVKDYPKAVAAAQKALGGN